MSTTTIQIDSVQKVDENLDRHLFSLSEWENFQEVLWNNPWASFSIGAINMAIHNILWSRQWVGEFFSDRYGTLYSTWEFYLARRYLEEERRRIKEILNAGTGIDEEFVSRSIQELSNITGSFHADELQKRHERMLYCPEWIDTLEDGRNCLGEIGRFRLPTSIEKCIWTPGSIEPIVWPWKSAQIVIATKKWTNEIAWVCMTYKTPTLRDAYENELAAHYGGRYTYIKRAMERLYDDLEDNGIMVFPVIGMLPKYASIRSMMRMMRDWARELISDEFAMTPWIAEMDMTNNFFDLCSRQLSVTPLTLLDHRWDPISAVNNRLDYCSTVVTFRAISAIEKARQWISSIVPRKAFNLQDNE